MNWQQNHNHTMDCPLTPTLRVSWSKPRSWHGENVTISLRSQYVKDGGQVTLEILATNDRTTPVETLGPLTLNNNRLDHVYRIDWKTKPVPAGAVTFEVKAILANPNTVATSDPMAVDLVVPVFSA